MKNGKTICITGGTSGLGLELVKNFLASGNKVITLSREPFEGIIQSDNLRSIHCDLAEFKNIQDFVNLVVSENISIDILINNAGVLSPPDYIETLDGFEFSYQVNFLSHYLLTKMLQDRTEFYPDLIVNVSSPIYKNGSFGLSNGQESKSYGLFKAYASTKMYMYLFSKRLSEEGISSFSFNPGTFNSGIYRMQKKWFHIMYKVAAPFMTSSSKVAKGMYNIIDTQGWANGGMMNKKGKENKLISFEQNEVKLFWDRVDSQISKYM